MAFTNSIALAKAYVPILDDVYKVGALTSVLDGSPELVREGANANELLVYKMSMDGLANYSRNGGYVDGNVSGQWETIPVDFDRGRLFQTDVMDDLETAGLAFGRLAGEFIRTKVAPEVDAWRLAKYASTAGVGGDTGTLATAADTIAALRAATNTMDEAEVEEADRVLFITPSLEGAIHDLDTIKSREVLSRFSQVVRVPQTRFYTAIDLLDGTTSGAEAGGYTKATAGKDINFMIVQKRAVIQFPKHTAPKIISPEVNQHADAYAFGYRLVGVADVYDNKLNGVYVHHKA